MYIELDKGQWMTLYSLVSSNHNMLSFYKYKPKKKELSMHSYLQGPFEMVHEVCHDYCGTSAYP